MTDADTAPIRVAALVKQIPAFESMALGPDGRLVREGLTLEMSAYCRRAVAEAVRLVEERGGSVTVFTLGPPSAEDVLREAIAYGTGLAGQVGQVGQAGQAGQAGPDEHDVDIRGVHVCDPAFAGSDTLATARALAAAISAHEASNGAPFDLVLLGRNSVDADTGQVPPQLAELLDRAFVTGVRTLSLDTGARSMLVGCELDDLWADAEVTLPALVSTAERLIDPCKIKDRSLWEKVDASAITTVRSPELGPGPWGAAGSPTVVGEIRTEQIDRARLVLSGEIDEQVARAVELLRDRGLLVPGTLHGCVPEQVAPTGGDGPLVAVVAEPGRPRAARELLAAAARLVSPMDGRVLVIGAAVASIDELGSWGADEVVVLEGSDVEEDVAAALSSWARDRGPWAVLVAGTPWGREVGARAAAALGAGLTGDAVGLAVSDARLLAWKPAFGGALVAAIRCTSPIQMATVRPGILPLYEPRQEEKRPAVERITVAPRGRVRILARRREDDVDLLANAEMVIGVGQGVSPDAYGELEGLRSVLGAELACTRKVTDKGWLPHARQLGITGKSISPRLYLALGIGGKYNHTVGVRSAGTILAVNPDPTAPMFDFSDIGIVGEWQAVVPELERQLRIAMAGRDVGAG